LTLLIISNAVCKHNSQYHLQIYCISKSRCTISLKTFSLHHDIYEDFFYECRIFYLTLIIISNTVCEHNSQYHLQIYCISKARCAIRLKTYMFCLLKCSMFNVMPAPCMPGEKYLKWVKVSPGEIPPNSVQGEEERGVPIYVCRAEYDGGVIPGKIFEHLPLCYLPWRGIEIDIRQNYQVGLLSRW
jgi:hypothetical protein